MAESSYGCRIALGNDFYIGSFIAYAARNVMAGGKSAYEWAEADSLYDAVDFEVKTNRFDKLTAFLD